MLEPNDIASQPVNGQEFVYEPTIIDLVHQVVIWLPQILVQRLVRQSIRIEAREFRQSHVDPMDIKPYFYRKPLRLTVHIRQAIKLYSEKMLEQTICMFVA